MRTLLTSELDRVCGGRLSARRESMLSPDTPPTPIKRIGPDPDPAWNLEFSAWNTGFATSLPTIQVFAPQTIPGTDATVEAFINPNTATLTGEALVDGATLSENVNLINFDFSTDAGFGCTLDGWHFNLSVGLGGSIADPHIKNADATATHAL